MDARYLYFYVFFFVLTTHPILATRVYVKPNDSVICPGNTEPCLTMNNYTEEPERYFSMSNTTFIFLPGVHKLNATVNVVNVSNFTLTSYHLENNTAYIIIVGASNNITWKRCNNVTILGLTFIVHGDSVTSLSPGLLFNSTTAVFTHLTIHQTRRVGYITIVSSKVVINHVLIYGTRNASGNAIFVVNSTVDFIGENIFSNIVAFNNGGAVSFIGSNVTFSGKTLFLNNVVACIYGVVSGGAIGSITSTVYFKGSAHFYNNSAVAKSSSCVGSGGVISAVDSTIVYGSSSDLVFSNNAATNGGAVFLSDSSLRMEGNIGYKFASNGRVVTFLKNHASILGGAIYAQRSTVELVNVSFESNQADYGGGAILQQDQRYSYMISCNFSNNSARHGGAVTIFATHAILGGGNSFKYNHATEWGGAIVATRSSVTLNGKNSFIQNTAETLEDQFALLPVILQ